MPKKTPVRMLARPVKTSVLGNDIEWDKVNAMRSGKRVPKSPSDPEISEMGWVLRVWMLCRLMDLMWLRYDDAIIATT